MIRIAIKQLLLIALMWVIGGVEAFSTSPENLLPKSNIEDIVTGSLDQKDNNAGELRISPMVPFDTDAFLAEISNEKEEEEDEDEKEKKRSNLSSSLFQDQLSAKYLSLLFSNFYVYTDSPLLHACHKHIYFCVIII